MVDKRWNDVADVLINYSTRVQPGERVLITMMEVETFPLARAVHAAAVKAGGLPHVEFQSMFLEGDLMRLGSSGQIDWVPEMQTRGLDWADVYIGLRGARNPHEWASIPAERVAAHKRATLPVFGGISGSTRTIFIPRLRHSMFAVRCSLFDVSFLLCSTLSTTPARKPAPSFPPAVGPCPQECF